MSPRPSPRLPLLALLTLGAGSCDGATKPSGPDATASTPSAIAPAASTAASALAPDPRRLLATCTDKQTATCKEYFGELPALVEDLCKGLEGKGVLVKGATPCARDKLLGTCTIDRGSSSEVHLHYAEAGFSANDANTSCELRAGTWQAAAASAPPR